MSTMMVETSTIEPVISAPPVCAQPASTLRLAKPITVAADLEEITFLDDHPLVPVFVIGAIALAFSVVAVGSIVFWLAIRYSGVLAP